MNCNSNHSLFLRSNGSLVCWDDHGSLKELQAFDPDADYANQVYLGPIYENIRARLRQGVMPFPEHCSKCFCLMAHMPMDDGRHVRERTIETFQIEPSMGCQLECPGCITKADRPGRVSRTRFGHMTLNPAILYKIVRDLHAAGVRIAKFDMQGHGEPLLNKKIWEICGFLSRAYPDSVISICTHANAVFVPHMVISGVNEILFSIDGVDQASYGPWRIGGSFDKAYRFMCNFSQAAALVAPHIRRVWKYVLFSHNDSDAHLLRAQQLALEAKVTTLRFVITQLGPASGRIFEMAQIPRLDCDLDVVIESYRIDKEQLRAAVRALRVAIGRDNIHVAQQWADFFASSLYRLVVTRPDASADYRGLADSFLSSIAGLPADQFGKYDGMIIRGLPSMANGLCRRAARARHLSPIPFVLRARDNKDIMLPPPPASVKVAQMRGFISSVYVDEAWYLETYADVRRAVSTGAVSSAAAHYRMVGYAESRLPAAPRVEPIWYLGQYPDLAAAHSSGVLTDPDSHFIHFGYREGRSASSE